MTEFYTLRDGDEFKPATFERDSTGRAHLIPVDDERAKRIVPTSWIELSDETDVRIEGSDAIRVVLSSRHREDYELNDDGEIV